MLVKNAHKLFVMYCTFFREEMSTGHRNEQHHISLGKM